MKEWHQSGVRWQRERERERDSSLKCQAAGLATGGPSNEGCCCWWWCCVCLTSVFLCCASGGPTLKGLCSAWLSIKVQQPQGFGGGPCYTTTHWAPNLPHACSKHPHTSTKTHTHTTSTQAHEPRNAEIMYKATDMGVLTKMHGYWHVRTLS